MISTRLYSYPPFWLKKPLGPCTLAIATAIVASTSNPASGVHNPSTNSNPAANSPPTASAVQRDRKSTRLNSSHVSISYAVFCLKKKKKKKHCKPPTFNTSLRNRKQNSNALTHLTQCTH